MAHEEDDQKSGTFTAYKRQRIGDDGDAVAFCTDMFDALETGHSLHHKRKADHLVELPDLVELPHLVSSELELAGTIVPVSDVFGYSVSDAKTAILGTDDVEAAVAIAISAADGGVKGRVTDPFDFNWIFYSPAKESDNKFGFSGISGMVLEAQSDEATGSAVKRRRMLHFDDDDPMETEPEPPSIHESSVSTLKYSEDASASSLKAAYDDFVNDPPTLPGDLDALVLDQYAKKLYADCINDRETHPLPDDDSSFGYPEVQMDVSEYLNLSPETETIQVMRPLTRSSANVIFKGKKTFAWLVPKLSSSFIYPFGLVKPSGVDGDMTLKDINQKISIQAAKPKEDKAEPLVIQTSAFSGKPVVAKTKFCTGGKGSITVMRTRG